MTVDMAPEIVVHESADLCEVEKILGYEFKDKRLLEEAFTHVSYDPEGSEFNYERLEYVGDSVIGLLFANKHFRLYPELSTGMLTRLRANNVDTEKLAHASRRHGLHLYLRHQKPLDKQNMAREVDQTMAMSLIQWWLEKIDPTVTMKTLIQR